jgi:hypothetical protein
MELMLLVGLGFGNGLGDLAFLVTFGVVALGSGRGDDVGGAGVLELAMGAILTIKLEASAAEIG